MWFCPSVSTLLLRTGDLAIRISRSLWSVREIERAWTMKRQLLGPSHPLFFTLWPCSTLSQFTYLRSMQRSILCLFSSRLSLDPLQSPRSRVSQTAALSGPSRFRIISYPPISQFSPIGHSLLLYPAVISASLILSPLPAQRSLHSACSLAVSVPLPSLFRLTLVLLHVSPLHLTFLFLPLSPFYLSLRTRIERLSE